MVGLGRTIGLCCISPGVKTNRSLYCLEKDDLVMLVLGLRNQLEERGGWSMVPGGQGGFSKGHILVLLPTLLLSC